MRCSKMVKALPQMPTKCNEKDGLSAWYIKHAWFRLQFNLDRLYLITFVTEHKNIQGVYRGGGEGREIFKLCKCFLSSNVTCIGNYLKIRVMLSCIFVLIRLIHLMMFLQ